MLDLAPIKKKLAFWASQPHIVTVMHKTYQEDISHADIAALLAEVERLREALRGLLQHHESGVPLDLPEIERRLAEAWRMLSDA